MKKSGGYQIMPKIFANNLIPEAWLNKFTIRRPIDRNAMNADGFWRNTICDLL